MLVTGGTGFLGAHLCRRLLKEGCRVVATSRRTPVGDGSGIEWRSPDLEIAKTARRLVAEIEPDLIYHLAGEVGAAPGAERVLPAFNSLLTSTVHLLMAALEEGRPRVLLAGSLTEPDDVGSAPVPTSPYSAAKWAASGYGRMFAALYELETVILRPFMTYGPGQKPEKLIPYVIESCLQGRAPRLSSGRQRSDWIFVDDVIDGMIAAAVVEGVRGETLDLGSGQLVSIREVVEMIVDLTATRVEPAFGSLPDRPLERERIADTVRAQQWLGWTSRTTLHEGLRRTVASFCPTR